MLFIVRLIFGALSRGLTRRRPRAARAPSDRRATTKKQALSGDRIQEIIANLPAADVLHVLDGDTLIVSKGRRQTTIRLDSIDCPEDGQHWGDIAAYGLIKLVGGRRVHLEEHGLDLHGRTLATIYVRHANGVEWVNVNERMVTLGHAWVMRRYYDHLPKDRRAKLNRLQAWAKGKRVGLWRTENPIPPWQWRKHAGAWSR